MTLYASPGPLNDFSSPPDNFQPSIGSFWIGYQSAMGSSSYAPIDGSPSFAFPAADIAPNPTQPNDNSAGPSCWFFSSGGSLWDTNCGSSYEGVCKAPKT